MLIPNPGLDFWYFDPKIHFWANLGPKIEGYSFCLKIGAQSISRMLIPNPDLYFWNFDLKIHFWANLGPNIQSCPFCLKIGALSILRMLIPNPDLDFWNFEPKIKFWANLGPKTQSCPFCLKIGMYGISRMLILIFVFLHLFSEFQFLISFLGKFWPKKSTLSVLIENWHRWYLEDADSYSKISFMNFQL